MVQITNRTNVQKIKKWMTVFGTAVCLMATAAGTSAITAYAAKEPTFQSTEETSAADAYVGEVNTDGLNVRIGFGADYEKLKVDGKSIVLHEGDLVAVMSSGTSTSGNLWYEIRWMEDGMEYHGYVRAKYVDLTDEIALPLATPTPTATPTPEPTPTPEVTEEPEPTEMPVTSPEPTQAPGGTTEKPGGLGSALKGIGLVLLLLVLAAAVYLYFMKRKKDAVKTETAEKIDSLKNIQLERTEEEEEDTVVNIMRRRPEPQASEVRETPSRPKQSYESEATLLARKEHARVMNEEIMERSRFYDPSEEKKKQDELKQLSESLKEKELLRDEIDNLIPGELVYHEYFGKGVVFDNSDVKVIEIRFGTDVRFINKASCVAKKLMRKV